MYESNPHKFRLKYLRVIIETSEDGGDRSYLIDFVVVRTLIILTVVEDRRTEADVSPCTPPPVNILQMFHTHSSCGDVTVGPFEDAVSSGSVSPTPKEKKNNTNPVA
jgi:hypothetical protein